MKRIRKTYTQPCTEQLRPSSPALMLVTSPGYTIDYDDNQEIIDIWQQGDDDEDIEID